jgi:SRSO17 transposase
LNARGQNYVGEVPCSFRVWTQPPEVLYRRHARDAGPDRPPELPRLKAKSNPMAEVRDVVAHSPLFHQQPWEGYYVKDGSKGPMVWQVKRLPVWLADDQGLPTAPHVLLVARNALDHQEVKYFLSNAPPDTSTPTLLLVAFSRWKVERMFEDGKGELGMDHFEVRKYLSLRRHLILSCLSYLFLAQFHQEHRGEKPGVDGLPGPHGGGAAGADLVAWGPLFAAIGPVGPGATDPYPAASGQGPSLPSPADDPPFTCRGAVSQGPTHMSLAAHVAL